MKAKQTIFLILEGALILVAIAVIYVLGFMQVKPTKVYRFVNELPANSIITVKDIESVEIPYSAVTPDFELDQKNLVGQAVKSEVYPGEYVFKAQLKDSSKLTAFDTLDLSDKVKVAIPINNLSQAVGGLLNSGDVVDLYYTSTYQELGNDSLEGSYYTTRFMEKVVIYKVLNETANESKNDVEVNTGKPPKTDEKTGEVIANEGDIAHVVVAVTAEQALEIQTRLKTGTISMVGRFEDTINKEVSDFILSPADGVEYGFSSVEKEN